MRTDNPLIVQSDKTILLDVHAPLAEECRNALIPFAELERSPEHLHTYRLTPLSLWNASGAGFSAKDAQSVLEKYSRYSVPQPVTFWIHETAERFGKLRLLPKKTAVTDEVQENSNDNLYLVTNSEAVYRELLATPSLKNILSSCSVNLADIPAEENAESYRCFCVKLQDRGIMKQKLLELGWPVKDEVPLIDGEPLEIELKKNCLDGKPFVIRDYQQKAANALVGNKGPGTGFGTIVLPCGAGKTIVGMLIMSMLKTNTLIVTTNISAVHQWINELLDKTTLQKEQIGEYSGESKTVKPVTVATYQVLTWWSEKDDTYPHFNLFRQYPWGLIIYDEVHTLPAPVFRVTAEIQAIRRVGLTATLVREDGCENHVFSLVGPKRYDVPWKELEVSGWIASAECVELRLDLPIEMEIDYAVATQRQKHRLASENPKKKELVKELVNRFSSHKILVIGQYIEQLNQISELLKVPIITGKTSTSERDKLYNQFRSGEIRVLVVSKVANFAIDLPDASMAIQVSGTFGSRQEEAQRLGRILRPKDCVSRFFTLISRNTVEEDFGSNRQKFLAEQGYSYRLIRYNRLEDLDSITEALPSACKEVNS